MSNNFHIIIPARYRSSRLPGKLLMDIDGITVIERVYQQALKSAPLSITIATDSEDIFQLASSFGAKVVMTESSHESGTDRIAEVIEKLNFAADDIVVNVQGDEPFIPPELIVQVGSSLEKTNAPMATLCWPIDSLEEFLNTNVVKVVRDQNNHALYFSRSQIPSSRDDKDKYKHAFRHIGIYAYRASFLKIITTLPACELELLESLEQLRVLWAGYKIKVDTALIAPLQDINTADDLAQARMLVDKLG